MIDNSNNNDNTNNNISDKDSYSNINVGKVHQNACGAVYTNFLSSNSLQSHHIRLRGINPAPPPPPSTSSYNFTSNSCYVYNNSNNLIYNNMSSVERSPQFSSPLSYIPVVQNDSYSNLNNSNNYIGCNTGNSLMLHQNINFNSGNGNNIYYNNLSSNDNPLVNDINCNSFRKAIPNRGIDNESMTKSQSTHNDIAMVTTSEELECKITQASSMLENVVENEEDIFCFEDGFNDEFEEFNEIGDCEDIIDPEVNEWEEDCNIFSAVDSQNNLQNCDFLEKLHKHLEAYKEEHLTKQNITNSENTKNIGSADMIQE